MIGFNDLEGTEEERRELVLSRVLGVDVLPREEDLCSDFKLRGRRVSLVVVFGLLLAGFRGVGLSLLPGLGKVFHKGIRLRNVDYREAVQERRVREATVDKLEGSFIGSGVVMAVDGEFGCCKRVAPVVLSDVDKVSHDLDD